MGTLKIYCVYCLKVFSVNKQDEPQVFTENCSYCNHPIYLKNISIRCPYCCFHYSECLEQPSYDSGDIETHCQNCQQTFTIHLDNFVHDPKFEISYEDLRIVLNEIDEDLLQRFLATLRLVKLPAKNQPQTPEEFTFLDKTNGKILKTNQLHARVLRNRDICYSFYQKLQDLIR